MSNDYAQRKAAFRAKVLPLYNQLSDVQQQVAFIKVADSPRVPMPGGGASLQILDFPGMTVDTFDHWAQQPYDAATVTFGGTPAGPSAIPVPKYNDLIKQLIALAHAG